MSTTVIMTSKRPTQKEIATSITNIKPDASDTQILDFVSGLASLSANSLIDVSKVQKSSLNISKE